MFKKVLLILCIFFVGCATVVQPKISRETTLPSISYEKTFEYAKYPNPNKEKGIVTLMAKAETGERTAKAHFFHYIVETVYT
ncbi:MAG: hypothetical protein NC822_01745 [Candidatus Omnitrophica bacterium]|nr:hypothetical protein [Candidatus Omnitrophota bacterium]MCM8827415.1 hypothetical protein [Candidatus Omnitrophota bacterium]